MIDFRSVRDTRASAFDFIQVRIASPEEIRGPKDSKERERLEMAGKLRAPDSNPHARAGLGDGAYHVAADKARAAIDGDQGAAVESNRHLSLSMYL